MDMHKRYDYCGLDTSLEMYASKGHVNTPRHTRTRHTRTRHTQHTGPITYHNTPQNSEKNDTPIHPTNMLAHTTHDTHTYTRHTPLHPTHACNSAFPARWCVTCTRTLTCTPPSATSFPGNLQCK